MSTQNNYTDQNAAYYAAWQQYYASMGYQGYYPYGSYGSYPSYASSEPVPPPPPPPEDPPTSSFQGIQPALPTIPTFTPSNPIFNNTCTDQAASTSNQSEWLQLLRRSEQVKGQDPNQGVQPQVAHGQAPGPIRGASTFTPMNTVQNSHFSGVQPALTSKIQPALSQNPLPQVFGGHRIIKSAKDELQSARWDKIQWVQEKKDPKDEVFEPNTILITGVPNNIDEDFLFNVFSTQGPIATKIMDGKPKIRIVRGEITNAAVIRFVDDQVANMVIREFSGKPFPGSDTQTIMNVTHGKYEIYESSTKAAKRKVKEALIPGIGYLSKKPDDGVLVGFVRPSETAKKIEPTFTDPLPAYKQAMINKKNYKNRAGLGTAIEKIQAKLAAKKTDDGEARSWECEKCKEVNFAFKDECEHCNAKKPRH